jgi:hypothetical protein
VKPTNPRTTNKPCPCGSGFTGLRTLRMGGSMYVCCAKCVQPAEQRTYQESRNEDAIRQAQARRRLEERRDEMYAGGEGEVW